MRFRAVTTGVAKSGTAGRTFFFGTIPTAPGATGSAAEHSSPGSPQLACRAVIASFPEARSSRPGFSFWNVHHLPRLLRLANELSSDDRIHRRAATWRSPGRQLPKCAGASFETSDGFKNDDAVVLFFVCAA